MPTTLRTCGSLWSELVTLKHVSPHPTAGCCLVCLVPDAHMSVFLLDTMPQSTCNHRDLTSSSASFLAFDSLYCSILQTRARSAWVSRLSVCGCRLFLVSPSFGSVARALLLRCPICFSSRLLSLRCCYPHFSKCPEFLLQPSGHQTLVHERPVEKERSGDAVFPESQSQADERRGNLIRKTFALPTTHRGFFTS